MKLASKSRICSLNNSSINKNIKSRAFVPRPQITPIHAGSIFHISAITFKKYIYVTFYSKLGKNRTAGYSYIRFTRRP